MEEEGGCCYQLSAHTLTRRRNLCLRVNEPAGSLSLSTFALELLLTFFICGPLTSFFNVTPQTIKAVYVYLASSLQKPKLKHYSGGNDKISSKMHAVFTFTTERMLIYYNPFSPPLSAVGVSSESESLEKLQAGTCNCISLHCTDRPASQVMQDNLVVDDFDDIALLPLLRHWSDYDFAAA